MIFKQSKFLLLQHMLLVLFDSLFQMNITMVQQKKFVKEKNLKDLFGRKIHDNKKTNNINYCSFVSINVFKKNLTGKSVIITRLVIVRLIDHNPDFVRCQNDMEQIHRLYLEKDQPRTISTLFSDERSQNLLRRHRHVSIHLICSPFFCL